MAHLIQLRQRLKAIETIKKITHAMRLISMSWHSRLRHQEQFFNEYVSNIESMFNSVRIHDPSWDNPYVSQNQTNKKQLFILVGSQRGLCGTFNSSLFSYFNKYLASNNPKKHINLIIVGKQAANQIKPSPYLNIISTFNQLQPETAGTIAHTIFEHIKQEDHPYFSVVLISNKIKSFFLQKPQDNTLIPFQNPKISEQNSVEDDFKWEQSPKELLDHLAGKLLQAQIHYLLFQSLLAEQAARFLSMDNATRNANTLFDETKLQYNKLRQAKITKELAELTGNL